MDSETKINDVIGEFKAAFGALEFKVVQAGTGLTVASRGWVEPKAPRLEISGDDFIALGQLGKGARPSKGVLAGMLRLMIKKG